MKIGQFLKAAAKKVVENKLGVTVGGAAAAAGAVGIVKPEVLELIPEHLRGYAVLAVVGVLCFERLKSGIIEIVHAIKDDAK